MFIDEINVKFKAGDGGPGTVSFRKEKFIPYGGPDGGNGGNGGNVIIRADARLENLSHLVKTGMLKAEKGRPGAGSKKHGRNGPDLVVKVPVGSLVEKNAETEIELDSDGREAVIARGGRGGMGNAVFATAVNRTPRIAQKGEEGEEGMLRLQVSLPCDIGIIGLPNSGKSTLLNRLTGIQVKIAEYPFTTREVVRGVLERGPRSYLVTETPGIIEGSHSGKGLGLGFLRHLKKAKVLIHLVDGTSPDVEVDIVKVNRELEFYDSQVAAKPQLVAVNKIDLPEVRGRVEEIRKKVRGVRSEGMYFISAFSGDGLENLIEAAVKTAEKYQPVQNEPAEECIVLFPEEKTRNTIYRKKDVVVIESPEIEEILKRMDILNQDAQSYMKRQFVRTGVARLLKKEGVKVGDRVRCGGVEWEWRWSL